ncbi:MAG: DUF6078 family protein [Parabacteroides sp.]|nr:DUF6078 family protein [Parabacteroides sp.]
MENTIDYLSVPHGFAHCFNHSCPKADQCLRALAAKQSASGNSFICIVNPAFYPSEGEVCSFYKKNEKVRMAWGITHLFDEVPYRKACELRKRLISHFNKSHYYRIYRKELPLTPTEQQYILRLFEQEGITKIPTFEFYTEECNW